MMNTALMTARSSPGAASVRPGDCRARRRSRALLPSGGRSINNRPDESRACVFLEPSYMNRDALRSVVTRC